jgi:carbon monoxide dehydrogenase subunit G
MKLRFKINKPIDFVFDYLTDMEKFALVHPVISKIDKTGNNTYLMHETLTLGFLPISFTYPASIEANKETSSVLMRAVVMRFTKINLTFTLNSIGDTTLVEETVLIKTFLPVAAIIRAVFRKQHEKLFANLTAIK